nr:protein associated with UVRAG as autophagy enhancer isoform X1 [Misgurnus anguillicaudatus]
MANKANCSSITKAVHFVSWLVNSELNKNHYDSTDDAMNESGLNECEFNACLPDPEKQYHLPRSSPVISRKRCSTKLKAEKQSSPSNLCLTPPDCDKSVLSTSPLLTVISNNSNLNQLDEITQSEKLEESSSMFSKGLLSDQSKDSFCISGYLDDSLKDFIGQSKILTNIFGTGKISHASQETQLLSHSSGDPKFEAASRRLRIQLNKGLQSGPKRRACSDIPLASDQRISEQARKHGSYIDVHSTTDLYRNNLDQENAHFVVVDMVLEVLEAVKWAVCLQQLKNTNPGQDRYETPNTTQMDSFSSVDIGFEDDSAPKVYLNRHRLASFQGSQSSSVPHSAEDLAHHLVSEFRKQWFPSEQLQNPDNLNIALQEYSYSTTVGDRISLTEEIRQKSRMRGTLTWAPPRFQIIFCVQPTHRRSDVIVSQHFLCAGCGTEVEPRYTKKLRYCDYLGKYFCDGCHSGEESVIPGRVLWNWDFARYPVCHFSRQLLDSIWQQPIFKLPSVGKNLYNQAKELQRFRDLQEQLISTKKLLSTCRLSAGVLAEFEQLPAHLMQELHLFSMDDFIKLKKGQLYITAKAIFQSATAHIDTCELCQAKGFICEFCHRKEVLFPFQKDTCTRCQDCRTCFHMSCFRDEVCPKCARLQKRKTLQEAIY